MTLESIKIGNLEIEIRPITLLIGYNGVGKSRFTQVIPLFTNFLSGKGYEGNGLEYGLKLEKLLRDKECYVKWSNEEIHLDLHKVLTPIKRHELWSKLFTIELFNDDSYVLDMNLGLDDVTDFTQVHMESVNDLVDLEKGYGTHKVTKYKVDLEFTKSISIKRMVQLLNTCNEMKNGDTLIIEHPELYLHPSKHLELGSLFSDLWTQKGIRTLIETHSENLILRLRKLVSKDLLNPLDVVINYFHIDEDSKSIEIRQLYFTTDGSYTWDKDRVKGLPMVFFGSDLLEALEIGV